MSNVLAVCMSEKKGEVKKNVKVAFLEKNYGIVGDSSSGPGPMQVALLGIEDHKKLLRDAKIRLKPKEGMFREHILTKGLSLKRVKIGTKLLVGDSILEVTQIGSVQAEPEETLEEVGKSIMAEKGIYCVVIKEGYVKSGDRIYFLED